jgi:recombinational DNA repair protein (RecF pathway)
MHEYVSRAVILDKQTRHDADARYSFFTERFGKVTAKAKSSRKIVSKLAGHLEPGTLASVRIIEQYGTQVVDALKVANIAVPMTDLASLNRLLPEWEPDVALWHEFGRQPFSWERILSILGWDPRGAVCTSCGRSIAGFYIARQEFFCAACASNFHPSEVILMSHSSQ